jgi:ABC-2 type transport system ATP-binding protein
MNKVLSMSGVTKKYPAFTLDSVSLTVNQGEIVGLIGENGAGKSTLISLILNQRKRDAGEINIFDLDSVKHNVMIKQRIGFLVDECCFHDNLNPSQINSIMKGIYKQWDEAEYMRLLNFLSVNPRTAVKDMSKGTKCKLMLCTAMAHSSDFLLLDEPTSGLDPIVRNDVLSLLKEYVRATNAAVLFSTHITSDIENFSDVVAFLHNGMLIFQKPIRHLCEQYVIVECSERELVKIPNMNIISKRRNGYDWTLLIKKNDFSSVNATVRIPRIEDIMLLYIKGEQINDWID